MFFSLIIPIHNIENYIGRCLDSIIAQKFSDLEALLIVNGSSDNSYEICSRYAEKYPFFRLVNLGVSGVSNARNWGLEHAQGDYIWFVDGDDFIAKDSLCQLKHEIQRMDYPDVLIFRLEQTYSDVIIEDESDVHSAYITKDFAINELYNSNGYNGYIANKIFKKDKLKVRFCPEIHMIEDLVFNTMNFMHFSEFVYCNYVAYYYRRRNGSISTTFDKKKFSSFKAYEILLDVLKDVDKFEEPRRVLNCAKVDFSRQILMYYYRNDIKEYKRIKKHYINIILDNVRYYKNLKSKVGAYLTVYAPRLFNCIWTN